MARESTLSTGVAASSKVTEYAPVALTDRAWLFRLGFLYALVSLLVMLALDRFWSNNWDVEIITQATRSLWDGGSLWDLYELSRASWPWPFPYPPLAAWILVPFIGLADLITGGAVQTIPQLIAIRIPPLLADVAIAWILYRIVARATSEVWIARLAAVTWLFNPVLFYHTAVQAHQESTWMLPVLLAFEWLQEQGLTRAWWPALLLVLALSLKQSAAFYVVPFGLFLLRKQRWGDVLRFGAMFTVIFGGIALPYLLYSSDFLYMVVEGVRDMPVQVQSWQVWALALPGYSTGEQTESTFFTVRYAAPLALLATAIAGGWALRKNLSWYTIGLTGTLCFFLFSQKVMGYHYLMILPWLVAFALREHRYRVVTAGLLWTSWVVVSPYFAPWAEASHLPLYALLGTLNSLFYGWLLRVALSSRERVGQQGAGIMRGAGGLLGWIVLLSIGFVLSSLAHPGASWMVKQLALASPQGRLAALLGLMCAIYGATLLLCGPITRWAARRVDLPVRLRHGIEPRWSNAVLALILVPLFFTWFTMTSEITSVLEHGIYAAWQLN